MVRIALIGCTGSIGTQTLDVIRRYPDLFSVTALVAGTDRARLLALKEEFSPRVAVCAEEAKNCELFSDCDAALIAASGFAGLSYTLAAIGAGKRVLLANKESLVCGGELVVRAAREKGVELVPVDSEHSAIFQALSCRRNAAFSKLILTASGGPFLHYTEEELQKVTAKDALRHPTWRMGEKVTIDSATLLNKGYEVLEAKWLFGADETRIEAVIHPESIVHSLVAFEDGAVLAQLGVPDMHLPIQFALTYPNRLPCTKPLDLASLGALHFERLPAEKFPCYTLALEAGREGGTAPTLLNAAGEEAVRAFLQGCITFSGIADTIKDVLSRIPKAKAESYAALEEADRIARAAAKSYIYGK